MEACPAKLKEIFPGTFWRHLLRAFREGSALFWGSGCCDLGPPILGALIQRSLGLLAQVNLWVEPYTCSTTSSDKALAALMPLTCPWLHSTLQSKG